MFFSESSRGKSPLNHLQLCLTALSLTLSRLTTVFSHYLALGCRLFNLRFKPKYRFVTRFLRSLFVCFPGSAQVNNFPVRSIQRTIINRSISVFHRTLFPGMCSPAPPSDRASSSSLREPETETRKVTWGHDKKGKTVTAGRQEKQAGEDVTGQTKWGQGVEQGAARKKTKNRWKACLLCRLERCN